MQKKTTKNIYLLFIIVLLTCTFLCSCSTSITSDNNSGNDSMSDTSETKLLGTWQSAKGYWMTFNQDGTGECQEENFNWWVSEGDGNEYLNIMGINFKNKKGRLIYHITNDDTLDLWQTYNNNKHFMTLYKQ